MPRPRGTPPQPVLRSGHLTRLPHSHERLDQDQVRHPEVLGRDPGRWPTLVIEDLRGYLASTQAMKAEGKDPFLLLGIIDSRQAEAANFIAICHRSLAEHRANLAWAWFAERKRLQAKIDRACALLDEALEIQRDLIGVRQDTLAAISKKMSQMERLVMMFQEKA